MTPNQGDLQAVILIPKSNLKFVNVFKFFVDNNLANMLFRSSNRVREPQNLSAQTSGLEQFLEKARRLANQETVSLNDAAALLGRLNSEIEFILLRNSTGDSRDISLLPELVLASLGISEKIDEEEGRVKALVQSIRQTLTCSRVVDPASAESLFRCAKLYAETHLPKGHEIMKEIFDAALNYRPSFAADCLEQLEPNAKLSSCQSLLNRLAQQATLDTPTLNSTLTVAIKTLPAVGLEETSFVDQVVAEVLHLNPLGLDVALTAATVMTGSPQTYIEILEKSLQVQPDRSAEICQVFLRKFQGQTDILETVISNLVEEKKFKVAEFLIEQISEPELKNYLQQVYSGKLNNLRAQNLQTEASEFAKQLAELLKKGKELDWEKVEQDIKSYSPDNRKLQKRFAEEVYRRFLEIANGDSSLKEQVPHLRSVILAIMQ